MLKLRLMVAQHGWGGVGITPEKNLRGWRPSSRELRVGTPSLLQGGFDAAILNSSGAALNLARRKEEFIWLRLRRYSWMTNSPLGTSWLIFSAVSRTSKLWGRGRTGRRR